MNQLRDLSILILGLGDSGLAMARWCARHGAARIRVWDSREAPPQATALLTDVPAAERFSGALDADLATGSLSDVQLVLKSPGLAPADTRIAPLLAAARAKGLAQQNELDLFARALADLKADRGYAPKVLAITGTNGKTTTTALTSMLVERCGKRVGLAGNIGPTMLDTLSAALDLEPPPSAEADEAVLAEPAEEPNAAAEAEPLDESAEPAEVEAEAEPEALPLDDEDALAPPVVLAPPPPKLPVFAHLPDVWVLELSSFQLDGVQGFEPSAATVLNVTQDHLDWHGTMAAYAAAKARIFGQHALMVVNRDDTLVEAMVPAAVVVTGGRGKPKKLVGRPVCRFGLDAPQKPGDFGLVTGGGMDWLVRAMPADETIKKRKGDDEDELLLQRLMPADALRIRGRHNAANALAALALCTAIGLPLAPMLHALREYRGEPHRVEMIGQIGGVEAFDDSKGTNVGATVAALDGLGQDCGGKLVVILGGDGKGQDFSPLAAPVARHARAVATIGRDAGAIEAVLAGSGVPLQRHATLEAATRWCFEQAQAGDAVLLSPACASLDMFRNYAHRAEVFISAVQDLAAERGEILT
ncbi:UDP-N-acetylmuramoyl-L-alanine--D-glutamate ligase [Ideonella azotifigens]|uniref:UDP-N-acetylmuramoylalanine--D-glutamate ligase n=2 Tax=Ideonella azotifigens TaxID=513160 RepID=A0ABN1KM18_9BURK|nr:UDP-N-acetylmuramoyl-L-alanine--D-glutamate ligase [Ideonella azotifigens]MCD2343410.1 UDP-N-acetylmuramoyl-L-alanine--D-glutamate ligase [Ideonella azotifigens]